MFRIVVIKIKLNCNTMDTSMLERDINKPGVCESLIM